jgi:uncharacterized protein YdhG (YjbR/CyaY superfamily)
MGTRRKDTTNDPETAARIRAYLAAQPPGARAHLKKIRETVLSAAPGALEGFSYRIPAVRLDGKALVWYAGFRNHVSLYPIGDAIRHRLAAELDEYETSKGTVRFPLSKSLPVALVKRLVMARIGELRSKP